MPPPPPLALIVSAHEWIGRSFESVLSSRGYLTVRAYSPRQALEFAAAAVPDLIFIGTELDDPMSGADLCRELQARLLVSRDTPVILISGRPVTRPERIEALRAGSWEVLILPTDTEELLLRVETYTQVRSEIERLRGESLIDTLTGLYNVRGLIRRAQELGSVAARNQAALACVAIGINDLAPSRVGAVATALRVGLRGGDIVGRLGPREFAVLALGADQGGAHAIADRLLGSSGEPGGADPGESALWAGLYGVPNFSIASIQPIELLVRAATALRRSRPGLLYGPITGED